MVDDTGKNDHAGASNPAPNQGNDPALEARIIEEFVVTPANAQKDTPPPPVAPLQPEVSATQPVVPSLKVLPPQPSKEMDMSSLLAGVKLPERRSTTPETPSKHVFDTSLSIDPEKQKEADAARAQAIITAQTTARTITEKLAEQKHILLIKEKKSQQRFSS